MQKTSAAIDLRPWREYIRNGEATFIIGAGISAEPPASLPLAIGLVRHLLDPLLTTLKLDPQAHANICDAITRLRPEVIIDILLEHLGRPALRPLHHTLNGTPNAWHQYLADALRRGCSVITTNFDTLIETCAAARLSRVVGKPRATLRHPRNILYKIHGSLERPDSIAFAVRQVGRGLTRTQTTLLRRLITNRPLIVLGYSGYDDFDILPALVATPRTAPGLWIIHDRASTLRPLKRSERRHSRVQPARACAAAWNNQLDILIGNTRLVRPARARAPRTQPPAMLAARAPRFTPARCAVALIYLLIEARAFHLVTTMAAATAGWNTDPRLLVARATAAEKDGTDLRGATTIAAAAVAAANTPRLQALANDQAGVTARRCGNYRAALQSYDAALRRQGLPAWLIAQIRSHKAVALEYLNRRQAAVREATAVAAYEARVGDLRGLAKSWNNIGIAEMNQRHWRRALDAFAKSEALKRELRDARGRAQTLHNRGKLFYLRGEYEAAEHEFTESLTLRRGSARDRHGIAQSLVALATVAKAKKDYEAARDYATAALRAHTQCGDETGIKQARALLSTLPKP